jgi:hypothetical protein
MMQIGSKTRIVDDGGHARRDLGQRRSGTADGRAWRCRFTVDAVITGRSSHGRRRRRAGDRVGDDVVTGRRIGRRLISIGGDVGGLVGDHGPPVGGDAGDVGGDVGGVGGLVGGDVGDWSAAMPDWSRSVHSPWVPAILVGAAT